MAMGKGQIIFRGKTGRPEFARDFGHRFGKVEHDNKTVFNGRLDVTPNETPATRPMDSSRSLVNHSPSLSHTIPAIFTVRSN